MAKYKGRDVTVLKKVADQPEQVWVQTHDGSREVVRHSDVVYTKEEREANLKKAQQDLIDQEATAAKKEAELVKEQEATAAKPADIVFKPEAVKVVQQPKPQPKPFTNAPVK